MTDQSPHHEPTNVQRAQWARNALAVFTAETYSGDHPDTMDRHDKETAIGDLICDLLHLARYHTRMDAFAIHSHALEMFEQELAEEELRDCATQSEANNSAKPVPEWLDALLDIKRLAEKSGDHEADPFALLDLIADRAHSAIAKPNGGTI
jgi:hypothetical protein